MSTGKVISGLAIASGGAVAASTAYDAHKNGVAGAKTVSAKKEADDLSDLYVGLSEDGSGSATLNAIHNAYADTRTKTRFFQNVYAIGGYMKGIGNTLLNNIVPVTCATAAIFGKKLVRQIGGVGLALYGINYAMSHLFNFGTRNTPLD